MIASIALLACPALGSAQSSAVPFATLDWAGPPARPVCVYKGVMSDAEIELCTGHPVHYDYRILSGSAASGTTADRIPRQPSDSG